jgi:hypothetical protein
LLIIISLEKDIHKLPEAYRAEIGALSPITKEGLQLRVVKKTNTVLVIGKDARGILYGVGRLLRNMELKSGLISVPENLSLATSPKYPIRGHQLGYRPKTNAYDAFTVAQTSTSETWHYSGPIPSKLYRPAQTMIPPAST